MHCICVGLLSLVFLKPNYYTWSKIVAVGDQYQLGVTDINTTNNFLKKADGIELLNKYKDQINPKLKQYNTN